MYEVRNSQFIKIFDELCYCHDRLTVFSDFVKMCAISIYNSFANSETLEKEYLRTINSYNKKEQELFTKLFAELIMMYEQSNEIVATISQKDLREIAETKLPDLNAYTVEEAMNIIEGTARNMGVAVKGVNDVELAEQQKEAQKEEIEAAKRDAELAKMEEEAKEMGSAEVEVIGAKEETEEEN